MFGSVLNSPSDNYEYPEVKAKVDRNVEAINKAMELTLLMPTLDVLEPL